MCLCGVSSGTEARFVGSGLTFLADVQGFEPRGLRESAPPTPGVGAPCRQIGDSRVGGVEESKATDRRSMWSESGSDAPTSETVSAAT